MNEVETVAESEIHDLVEAGRKRLGDAQRGADSGLNTVTDYVRANPWAAISIAAGTGILIAFVAVRPKARPQNLKAMREWVDIACSKLPNEKQVRSVVDSTSPRLRALWKKLHLN